MSGVSKVGLGEGESCDDCLWFQADYPLSNKQNARTGKCRRHAPAVSFGGDEFNAVWPKVRRWSDWCGEGEKLADEEEEGDDA